MNGIAICLTALAVAASPALAESTPVAQLLPGQMNAAGFINVRAIMDDYGMLFDGGPIAEQIDQFVAMGMPDPRSDIEQVGMGGTIEALDDDKFVVVATGSIPVENIAQFAAMQAEGTIREEAYRGITFYGIEEPDSSAIQVKMANLGPDAAMGTFDRKGLHPFGRLTADTAAGQNTSFGAKYGTELSAGEYAEVSIEVPKSTRQDLERDGGQFAFLSLVAHARASLTKTGDSVRLAVDGVCMDMFDAETVKRAIAKGIEMLKEQISDPEFQAMLDSVQITREENTAKISFELPEDVLKDILGGFTGADSAD